MIKHETPALDTAPPDGLALLENPGDRLTPELFGRVYDLLFGRVFNYFAYRTANREEAEDLTAQVFERMISRYAQFDPRRGSFESWLFAIARHTLTNQSRTAKRRPQTVLTELIEQDNEISPDRSFLRREELARLQKYIGQLGERDRELIALRYGANLSQRRVGELLKMSENNVAVALGRALRRLRRLFEAEEVG